MLRFLKKLWNWLKSLCGWTGLPQKQRLNPAVTTPKPEPSDADYENILMGLFAEVAQGTTSGGLKGWLYAQKFNDKQLARWLVRKGQEWRQYPQNYQQLAQDLHQLAQVAVGDLGEVARRISQDLTSPPAPLLQGEGSEISRQGKGGEISRQGNRSEISRQGKGGEISRQGNRSEISRQGKGGEILLQGDGSEILLQGDGSEISRQEEAIQVPPFPRREGGLGGLGQISEAQSPTSDEQVYTSEGQFDEEDAYKKAWDLIYLEKYEKSLIAFERILQIKPNSYNPHSAG